MVKLYILLIILSNRNSSKGCDKISYEKKKNHI